MRKCQWKSSCRKPLGAYRSKHPDLRKFHSHVSPRKMQFRLVEDAVVVSGQVRQIGKQEPKVEEEGGGDEMRGNFSDERFRKKGWKGGRGGIIF